MLPLTPAADDVLIVLAPPTSAPEVVSATAPPAPPVEARVAFAVIAPPSVIPVGRFAPAAFPRLTAPAAPVPAEAVEIPWTEIAAAVASVTLVSRFTVPPAPPALPVEAALIAPPTVMPPAEVTLTLPPPVKPLEVSTPEVVRPGEVSVMVPPAPLALLVFTVERLSAVVPAVSATAPPPA